jgi:hypothetical protein
VVTFFFKRSLATLCAADEYWFSTFSAKAAIDLTADPADESILLVRRWWS